MRLLSLLFAASLVFTSGQDAFAQNAQDDIALATRIENRLKDNAILRPLVSREGNQVFLKSSGNKDILDREIDWRNRVFELNETIREEFRNQPMIRYEPSLAYHKTKGIHVLTEAGADALVNNPKVRALIEMDLNPEAVKTRHNSIVRAIAAVPSKRYLLEKMEGHPYLFHQYPEGVSPLPPLPPRLTALDILQKEGTAFAWRSKYSSHSSSSGSALTLSDIAGADLLLSLPQNQSSTFTIYKSRGGRIIMAASQAALEGGRNILLPEPPRYVDDGGPPAGITMFIFTDDELRRTSIRQNVDHPIDGSPIRRWTEITIADTEAKASRIIRVPLYTKVIIGRSNAKSADDASPVITNDLNVTTEIVDRLAAQ